MVYTHTDRYPWMCCSLTLVLGAVNLGDDDAVGVIFGVLGVDLGADNQTGSRRLDHGHLT